MDAMQILKVLADDTRLRMLKLLQTRTLCVCELQGALKLNQSNASRHLSRMKEANLVCQEKNGQWIYYGLNQAVLTAFPFIGEILAQALIDDLVLAEAEKIVQEYQVEGNPCTRSGNS
jgi:ArsR family transcriptional regulator